MAKHAPEPTPPQQPQPDPAGAVVEQPTEGGSYIADPLTGRLTREPVAVAPADSH